MNSRRGQSIAEYFIILVVILAAVLASAFRDKIKLALGNYFGGASRAITSMNP